MAEMDTLAEEIAEQWALFQVSLLERGPYPKDRFFDLTRLIRKYVALSKQSPMIHKKVASTVNGLRETLELERKRVPGEILYEADRVECLFFAGYDPHFEGDEPPGL